MSLRRLLLLFPLLFLAEVVFGEAGRWMEVGGLSVRQVLFVLAVLGLYGYAALHRQRLEFGRMDAAVLLFLGVNVVWGFLVPGFYEQSLGLAFADFGAVFVLLLYFPLAALVRAGVLSWRRLKVLFLGGAVLLALLQVTLWTLATWMPETMSGTRRFLLEMYGVPEIYVGPMPDGFFRVMPVTALFLLPAFFLIAHTLTTGRRPLSAAALLFLIGGGLVVSYTRTFWLAVVLGLALAVAALLLGPRHEKGAARLPALARKLGRELSPLVVFVAAFMFVGAVDAGQDLASNGDGGAGSGASAERAASTLDAGDRSVAIKLQQLPPLIGEWRTTPVFGQGFGASAEEFARSEETPFSYEVMAPALLMKLGVVGSLLWLAPLLYFFVDGLRSARAPGTADRGRFAVAGLICFALAVQSNPLFFNFVGMTLLLFYLLELSALRDRRTSPKPLTEPQ
ncbi:MAG: hypothetical protein H0V53_12205 [Rubrobacter sp.]|nr:hypothetical protein [Rubrobacter sp.]